MRGERKDEEGRARESKRDVELGKEGRVREGRREGRTEERRDGRREGRREGRRGGGR